MKTIMLGFERLWNAKGELVGLEAGQVIVYDIIADRLYVIGKTKKKPKISLESLSNPEMPKLIWPDGRAFIKNFSQFGQLLRIREFFCEIAKNYGLRVKSINAPGLVIAKLLKEKSKAI